ncbi:4-hydroxy-tetrahydrodipicolinate reductase [Anaeromicrobium sediminis]|uniref:4-hydroxy-tetrahydrodipicolinate reductase n=1 Tax=Anaeromicrobium sediminis TaxID=1478221 RepID=A0A267ML05_9FIRM|nr:4-hydroxy-tetrahydrodipicolinate reductase [Anaeromicrobium sediminis]PAB59460.1 4-hydroxy-tetrahydrodipicolinate reductase [Anaeromicrobium sediminis]
MIKVIVHGCCGKMGQVLVNMLESNPNTQVVAGIDKFCSNHKYDFPVFEKASDCNVDAQVVIDFSHYSLVSPLLDFCKSSKLPLVLCTTGLSQDLEKEMVAASKEVAIFKSGNMSLGINLLIDLVKKATAILSDFDVEIIEKHHNKKVDSPSGTAFMIANAIKDSHKDEKELIYGRYGNNTKRESKEIGIHAVRGGTIVGEHTAIYAGEDEIIEIKHAASSKKVFAQGSIKAALYIANKEPGLYNMDDLLK